MCSLASSRLEKKRGRPRVTAETIAQILERRTAARAYSNLAPPLVRVRCRPNAFQTLDAYPAGHLDANLLSPVPRVHAGKWHRGGRCRRRCRSCIRTADAPAPDACVRRFPHGRLRATWRAKAWTTAAGGVGIRSRDAPSAALAPVAASDATLSKLHVSPLVHHSYLRVLHVTWHKMGWTAC